MEEKWRDYGCYSADRKSTGLASASVPDAAAVDKRLQDRPPVTKSAAAQMDQQLARQMANQPITVAVDQNSPCLASSNHVAKIHPSVQPTTHVSQSEFVSALAVLASSTPLKLSSDEKSGEFVLVGEFTAV